MPAAVDASVVVEVDEVDQQLIAAGALETLRVPTSAVSRPTGEHGDVAATDLSATLEKCISLRDSGVCCFHAECVSTLKRPC